ncbi:sporulation protein YqfD [Jeotgalibacillus salarius]|uniref:Sporulation protein YqfD n=1 Tax=Jeotgalibacillus salarius TaxID=546023 RepID=A0A4Y8LJ59_9BACL|nr:sporulation protein YqfD [Jeotgalibacillus salarius]TFE01112.1 hypothetical protein E2626_10655 [Jeotgalibacillus salarius]
MNMLLFPETLKKYFLMVSMMIKKLLRVRVEIKGENGSLILSRLLIDRIHLKDIVNDSGNMTFVMHYSELHKLRKAARHTGCSISLSREGKNSEILTSLKSNISSVMAFFISLIIFLNAFQYIWTIDITGANPEIRSEAAEVLTKNGVRTGIRHSDLLSNQESAAILYKEIEQLSWTDFELKGSKLIVSLREKDFLADQEDEKNAHLVASKTGTVHTISVSSGTPVVKRDEVVSKGEILVSGYIGREGYEKAVTAKGTVKALTWYTVNVSMPQIKKGNKFTGQTYNKYALKIDSFTTPFVSLERDEYNRQIRSTDEKRFTLFGYELPFQIIKQEYKEVSEEEMTLTSDQYKEVLTTIAAKDVLSVTDGNGQILEEKILHEDIENGKVKLTIFYQVIENIAETKPFTEETRE